MPSATTPSISVPPRITKFTNCRLVKHDKLVKQDLWVSSETGKILEGQEVFYGQQIVPDRVVDLGGRILSPGLIDVQLNGAFGFNFSVVPEDVSAYPKTLRQVNKSLVTTGITSYLPTLTSQKSEVYHQVSGSQSALYEARIDWKRRLYPSLDQQQNGSQRMEQSPWEHTAKVPSYRQRKTEFIQPQSSSKHTPTPISKPATTPQT